MSGRQEEILEAGLEIARERGLAAVSMRAVAERVGVTPMALYPHVGSKAALLDGMVGRLLSRLPPPDAEPPDAEPPDAEPPGAEPPGDWRAQLAGFAHRARALAQEHPWSPALLLARPAVTPDAVRAVDQVYTALLAAGVPPDQVPRAERMVGTFLLGFLASEAGGRFGPGPEDPRGRRGRLPEGALPGHTALARWLDAPVDWDAEFRADLADLERLIEAMAAPPARPPA